MGSIEFNVWCRDNRYMENLRKLKHNKRSLGTGFRFNTQILRTYNPKKRTKRRMKLLYITVSNSIRANRYFVSVYRTELRDNS